MSVGANRVNPDLGLLLGSGLGCRRSGHTLPLLKQRGNELAYEWVFLRVPLLAQSIESHGTTSDARKYAHSASPRRAHNTIGVSSHRNDFVRRLAQPVLRQREEEICPHHRQRRLQQLRQSYL